MKSLFKLSIVTASVIAATTAFAANPSNAQLQREIHAVMQRDAQLQHDVKMLKAQLNQKQMNSVKRGPVSVAMKTTSHSRHVLLSRFDHDITITSSPLMGKKDTWDPSDILEQYSKTNLPLTLLEQRSMFQKDVGLSNSDAWRPVIEISGGLEGQLTDADGYGIGSDPRGINLSAAELDFYGMVGPWAGGFMALDYNDSPSYQGVRETSGTFYLRDGFATIGNLNRFPLYFSIGKMRVPFGRFSSLMLTDPVTQTMADTRSTTALLGLSTHGIYASVFGFTGNQTSGGHPLFKQGGANLGFKSKFGAGKRDSVELGTSMTSNLADANGMQSTGYTSTSKFRGFEVETNGNEISRRTPALSVYGSVGLGNFTAISEFITALRNFKNADLAFGSSSVLGSNPGASPKALHLEVNYTIHAMNRPITFGASYGRTWQALAINDPKQSFTADVQTSWFRNTLETIEYRRDDDYGTHKFAHGRGMSGGPFAGTGKSRNSYIAQLGVYF